MFTKPPSVGTTALLVVVAIVVATGCTASPTGVTTISTEHLGELNTSVAAATPTLAEASGSDETDPDDVSIDTAATTSETSSPDGETALGPQEHAESPTEDGAEVDLSDLDALLADLDGLLGDIDNGMGQLGDSFDNNEGDVEE